MIISSYLPKKQNHMLIIAASVNQDKYVSEITFTPLLGAIRQKIMQKCKLIKMV